ncbi:MAG: DUF3800 domain-containing protein [Thermoguttaceae bacterium]|nr:DUF3800 domain-containing protein [Thermoguttaceae bacterium]MBQ9800941.1 DUF3800 domain-containing protein [Thermoguttaceae bacterium]
MKKVKEYFAFVDESGSHGWDFDKDGNSRFFVVTAIIVESDDVANLREEVEKVRKQFFQTGEIKSSKIGKNNNRRKNILNAVIPLPFKIFAVVFDKSKMLDYRGLHYKTSFYKFLNNIVHKELSCAFANLTVVADEIGGSDYMQSFSAYVKANEKKRDLLGVFKFVFQNSAQDVLIQLADLIAGTLAASYRPDNTIDWKKILREKTLRLCNYPLTTKAFNVNNPLAKKYDAEIAEICLRQVDRFISTYEDDGDEVRKQQVLTLKYLAFRFLNNDLRNYIQSKELIGHLAYAGFEEISARYFKTEIIAPMRDSGVIIASSPRGYKIPAREQELNDFVANSEKTISPMISRLIKCHNLIKVGTNGRVNLAERIEDLGLKELIANNER